MGPDGLDRGLVLADGWMTGVLAEEDLGGVLAFVPPEILEGLEGLIPPPDVDSDGDGGPDAYGMCVRLAATPVALEHYPPME